MIGVKIVNKIINKALKITCVSAIAGLTSVAHALPGASGDCSEIEAALAVAPGGIHGALSAAIAASPVATSTTAYGGFGLHMWTSIVNRDGYVCAVAFSGADRGAQWPASRVISFQKAHTANSLSLDGLALSTANLYGSNQPGGAFFGVQFSNPVDGEAAYAGDVTRYGQSDDPAVGVKAGGVNVFGGGLALYNAARQVVGALGSSGDSPCKDHNYAWHVRSNLGLDFVPGGVSGDAERPDNIIYDMGKANKGKTKTKSGFGHINCQLGEKEVAKNLPPIQ